MNGGSNPTKGSSREVIRKPTGYFGSLTIQCLFGVVKVKIPPNNIFQSIIMFAQHSVF